MIKMDFRITETSKGFIVEKKTFKWSLFGLKTKWIPFVKSAGLQCAWHHKTYDYAMMNLIEKIKKNMDLIEEFKTADLFISRDKRVARQIKIADKYAIDFVAWIDKNKKETKNIIIIEELLEMYKKSTPY